MEEKTKFEKLTWAFRGLVMGLLLLFFFTGIQTEATEKRNVKVAFFPMEGYHNVNADGSLGGMDVAYLNTLSGYVGWSMEYVPCDSWDEALELLKNEEVDLVGSAQYSAERAEIYQYADISSGYTFGVIATNADKDLAYEDFQAMESLSFGMVESYVRKAEFLEYLSHNGIQDPKLVEYSTTAELKEAVHKGEVDAFVHTFTEVEEGQRLIGRFAPRPFYYITYKGNDELMRELNQAVVDLKMNLPELETELMNRYFYSRFDKTVLFTTEEKSYLAEKKSIKVGFLDNYYPFSYLKDGAFTGLTRELLESSLGISGLEMEYVLFENRQDARKALSKGEIDLFAYSMDRPMVLQKENLKSICDYAQVPLVLVTDKSKTLEEVDTLGTVSFLEEKALLTALGDGVQVVSYTNLSKCMEAVAAGEVDAILCDGYFAEHYMRTDVKYGNLQVKSVLSGEYSISLAIQESNLLLESVLRKTIDVIDSKMINEYMLRENTYPLVSVTEFIKDNSIYIIALLIAVFLCVIYIIVKILKKNLKIQKLMYKDAKMDIWNLNYLTYWGEHKLLPDRKGSYAIAYLNIAKFRRYNIIYGWAAGERLLEGMAEVLTSHVNEKTEICARSQGDRFVLLLNYKEEEAFRKRIELMKREVEARIQLDTGDHMRLLMGVYLIPAKETDLRQAMDFANQALAFVDDNKGEDIQVYDKSLQTLVMERHDREQLLESVDMSKDFIPFYQPKVDIRDGSIVGAEALVRFKDPNDGSIKSPAFFVPYYEQTGRIKELDFVVLEAVCRFLAKRIEAGLPVVTISCNFSRIHFVATNFIRHFEDMLEKYNIPKSLIEVEVTETLLMEEMEHEMVKNTFTELKNRGIHLSIDDFGSGYSSLGIFEQIPASVVKMDRSFFLNQVNPERQIKIMRGIVNLSEELDAQIVCEGVETEADVALMREIGAYVAQGYFYSKPIPEEEFVKKLAN